MTDDVSVGVMSGEEMMRMIAGGGRRGNGMSRKPTILPEARIATLREALERLRTTEWDVGDVITPIAGMGVVGTHVGEPHIVMRIRDLEDAMKCDQDDSEYMVATIDADGDLIAAWVPGWKFEEYKEK